MNEEFINELSKRVYDNLGEKFINDLKLFGIPLPDDNDLANHIRLAINYYVSSEEQEKYLLDNLGDLDDEVAKSLLIKIAIHMASLDVIMKTKRKLTSENDSDKDDFNWAI